MTPPILANPLKFRRDLWHHNTRVPGLLCGVFAWSYVWPF